MENSKSGTSAHRISYTAGSSKVIFHTSHGPNANNHNDFDESLPLLAKIKNVKSSNNLIDNMDRANISIRRRFLDRLAVNSEPVLSHAQRMLQNHDLKPVELEKRQWRGRNFVAFWIADSFNINTWMIASASILDGLSWWQAWLCVWIGYAIAACFVCSTGRIGATYHIAFPVVSRASFGIWGSLWPVLNRTIMACVWYGVQSWIGGTCIYLMIRAIWPSWDNHSQSNNTMMEGSGTNTRDFLSFLIFWAFSLPFLWFPVHKIRHLFTIKACIAPSAGIALFVWAVVRAKGIGSIVEQQNTVHGSQLGWTIIKAIMSCIANFATLIVNNPDFARFARERKNAFWPQILTIPVGFGLTSFIGIIVSSSSGAIYGEPIWSPLDLLKKFLHEPDVTGATRFGVFVIASSFVLAQLGTNIAANSVSAGTDMTALLPRYINIRRGSYICAAIGLVMCPWHLLSSSNNFISYLSAYSVFLSSIAGVMVSDYYFVRRGYLQIRELYSAQKGSPYHYTWGIHWRGYIAYIAGILINVVGFAGAVGTEVPVVATYIYNLNFFCGFLVAAGIYYLLCRLSPIPATSSAWMEVDEDAMDRNNSLSYGTTTNDVEDGLDVTGDMSVVPKKLD